MIPKSVCVNFSPFPRSVENIKIIRYPASILSSCGFYLPLPYFQLLGPILPKNEFGRGFLPLTLFINLGEICEKLWKLSYA